MPEVTVTLNGTQYTSGPTAGAVKGMEESGTDNGARDNFFPMIEDLMNEVGAIQGNGVLSTTSLAIGTGSKAFTVTPTTVIYDTDTVVKAVSAADNANFMIGTVTASSAGSLTISVASGFTGGSGTYADWVIVPFVAPVDSGGSAGTIETQSANFNIADDDSGITYLVTDTADGTLPAADDCDDGYEVTLKNGTDGKSVRLVVTGDDLIDGQTFIRVPGRSTITVRKQDDDNWYIHLDAPHQVGDTKQHDSNTLPRGGWAWKNGQALSRTTYAGAFEFFCPRATVTVTIASPGVFSHTAHGYENNQPVVFRTTGALPTGLTAGTTYYIVNKNTDDYQVSATPGGAAINTSGSQSGVHTAIYTAYGDGDGSTTFNVPDERGRVKAGSDTMGTSAASRLTSGGASIHGNTLGAAGGAQTHTLTAAESGLASHGHSLQMTTDNSNTGGQRPLAGAAGGGADTTSATPIQSAGGSSAGSAHQNTQPTIIANFIVKT